MKRIIGILLLAAVLVSSMIIGEKTVYAKDSAGDIVLHEAQCFDVQNFMRLPA